MTKKQSESIPTIMMVKRSYFSKNKIQGIEEILEDDDADVSLLVSQIMDYKLDNVVWDKVIPKEEIDFVQIPYSQFIVEKDAAKVEIVLPSVVSDHVSEDGKVSFLLLLGSILILLGVLVSILMLYE